MNLPSGSVWAKLVKECFGGSNGWLFGGSDFAALEDMVGSLLTNDPNKMEVYTKGYDSHSLRANYYWPMQMPDIQAKLAKKHLSGKFYKLIKSNGIIEYFHESDL